MILFILLMDIFYCYMYSLTVPYWFISCIFSLFASALFLELFFMLMILSVHKGGLHQ